MLCDLLEVLAQIIKALAENKEELSGKFKKGKRLHIIADFLGPSFYPPVWPKKQAPTGDEAQKVKEFYKILAEFDRKYEFAGAMVDRFIKIYNAYLNRLKQIHKQLTDTAKQ